MNFCPRAFNSDMTDPRNIEYCQEIQRQDGYTQQRGECEARRCMYSVPNKKKQKFLVAYNKQTW